MTAGLETFAKVRALHDSTTSPGEKAAAAGRMKKLARNAGLTVAQAKSKLDTPAPAAPRNFFEDLFNTPEFRASAAERERRYAARREAALAEYGTEEAVWQPCAREQALEEACRPVITRKPILNGETDTLMGWDGGGIDRMPPEVRAAVARAFPEPPTTREAWDEFSYWEKRSDDLCAFDDRVDLPICVRARKTVLEHLLDTLPALSMNDLRARMAWMVHLNEQEWMRGNPEERRLLDQLVVDIERMGARLKEEAASVQNGHAQGGSGDQGNPDPFGGQNGQAKGVSVTGIPLRRTNADKRRDVLALLDVGITHTAPLTDREIARRAGVSPQTVGNIRRSLR